MHELLFDRIVCLEGNKGEVFLINMDNKTF